MEPLAMLAILSAETREGAAWSALPDAPVLPEPETAAVGTRVRASFAASLRRLADAVAPPASALPARRPTACEGL